MYVLAGIPHLATLVAPPLSGVLMVVKVWLPFVFAIGALTLSLLIVMFMPESLNRQNRSQSIKGHSSPLLGAADTLTPTASEEETPSSPEQLPRGVHDRLPGPSPERKEWWRDIIVLVQMPGLPFCYTLFFFKPLAMISKAFVYQYASYNFHWILSQTTWLRFSQAGGSTVATIAVLPLLSSILVRRGLRAQILDINVIRISLLIAAIGFVLLQFSYHSWMLLFGRCSSKCSSTHADSISPVHLRPERGRGTGSSGASDITNRPHLSRKIIHLGGGTGNLGEAHRWSYDGQTIFYWQERRPWFKRDLLLGICGM